MSQLAAKALVVGCVAWPVTSYGAGSESAKISDNWIRDVYGSYILPAVRPASFLESVASLDQWNGGDAGVFLSGPVERIRSETVKTTRFELAYIPGEFDFDD